MLQFPRCAVVSLLVACRVVSPPTPALNPSLTHGPASAASAPTSAALPSGSSAAPSSNAAPSSEVVTADVAPDVAAPRDRDYPWMSLETWWQRQRALLAIDPALKRKSELAFLGDSITEGWDDAVWNEFYARHHPVRLGLGGDKTQQVLFRIEHGELSGLRPKVLVLLIGTNNFGLASATPAAVARGVAAVISAVQAKLPTTRVLLLGILPRDELPEAPIRQLVTATNAILAQMADGQRVRYLDIGKSFSDASGRIPRELMADFLHPTAKGYRVFAKALAPTLRELLANPEK